MGAFAVAVHAVVDDLENSGFAILEAVFEAGHTPHVVAERGGRLQFVLVQGLEGPHVAEFNEETHYARMLALVEAVTWHPRGAEVARLAAAHRADARLALVGLLPGDVNEQHAEPTWFARLFPYRKIDHSGHILAIEPGGGPAS